MKTVFTICTLITALPAFSQEIVSAERPSFSSSPLALDAGFWQLEGGYQYTRVDSGVDAHALPLMLLRYGAGERTELQISWSGFNKLDVGSSSVDGISDMSVGVKWQLSEENANTPIGLFAALSFPIGDDEFSSNEIDPTVGLFWAHEGRASLFGTVLLSEFDNDTALANAVGLNLSMGDTCDNCSAYVEYFGVYPENSGPQHNINGGISWLRSHQFVIDVNVGIGLNSRAADGYLGFGAAYRF